MAWPPTAPQTATAAAAALVRHPSSRASLQALPTRGSKRGGRVKAPPSPPRPMRPNDERVLEQKGSTAAPGRRDTGFERAGRAPPQARLLRNRRASQPPAAPVASLSWRTSRRRGGGAWRAPRTAQAAQTVAARGRASPRRNRRGGRRGGTAPLASSQAVEARRPPPPPTTPTGAGATRSTGADRGPSTHLPRRAPCSARPAHTRRRACPRGPRATAASE